MGFPIHDDKMLENFIEHTEPIVKTMRKLYPICVERKGLFDRVKRLMEWDDSKVELWFTVKSHQFGGISPDHLLVSGRGVAVESFIKEAEANKAYQNAD